MHLCGRPGTRYWRRGIETVLIEAIATVVGRYLGERNLQNGCIIEMTNVCKVIEVMLCHQQKGVVRNVKFLLFYI